MKVDVYHVHNIKKQEVDLIFVKGVAYAPGCYNCKYSGEPRYDKDYNDYVRDCCMMCVKDVCRNDICETFVFEPKEPYKGEKRWSLI